MATALGFCVAFVFEEVVSRAKRLGETGAVAERAGVESQATERLDMRRVELAVAYLENGDAEGFADRLLQEGGAMGEAVLEGSLGSFDLDGLTDRFVELMARDLDDYRAMAFAGRALREIAERSPEVGVALLYSLSAAEKERLVPELARGWVAADAAGAFAWIRDAWVDAEGNFIDRALQNELYIQAMDTLVSESRDYGYAGGVIEGVADLKLRGELVRLVAKRVVRDGPEQALARLGEAEGERLEGEVLDAIALEWAARDRAGAMAWALANEGEMSEAGVAGIAKQLELTGEAEALAGFFGGLETEDRRDAVAAEVARLQARRDPVAAAEWISLIGDGWNRRSAAEGAMRELGYESLERSADFLDLVYGGGEGPRGELLGDLLLEWVELDADAVAEFVASGRAQLSAERAAAVLEGLEKRVE